MNEKRLSKQEFADLIDKARTKRKSRYKQISFELYEQIASRKQSVRIMTRGSFRKMIEKQEWQNADAIEAINEFLNQ